MRRVKGLVSLISTLLICSAVSHSLSVCVRTCVCVNCMGLPSPGGSIPSGVHLWSIHALAQCSAVVFRRFTSFRSSDQRPVVYCLREEGSRCQKLNHGSVSPTSVVLLSLQSKHCLWHEVHSLCVKNINAVFVESLQRFLHFALSECKSQHG